MKLTLKFSLPSGATGFTNDAGKWVCTGSQMGRRNILPIDRLKSSPKMRLVRLPFIDGCYDRWGAYWGSPANVYCAESALCGEGEYAQIFVRGNSRDEAKQAVRALIPQARFYR